MEINKENQETHSIQSYHEQWIQIAGQSYSGSVLLSQQELISPWGNLSELSLSRIQTVDLTGIELIIMGHLQMNYTIPFEIRQYLANQGIGLEIMGLGPACRTFNILLGEHRQVIGLFYLSP